MDCIGFFINFLEFYIILFYRFNFNCIKWLSRRFAAIWFQFMIVVLSVSIFSLYIIKHYRGFKRASINLSCGHLSCSNCWPDRFCCFDVYLLFIIFIIYYTNENNIQIDKQQVIEKKNLCVFVWVLCVWVVLLIVFKKLFFSKNYPKMFIKNDGSKQTNYSLWTFKSEQNNDMVFRPKMYFV